jgi:hypothetical protein
MNIIEHDDYFELPFKGFLCVHIIFYPYTIEIVLENETSSESSDRLDTIYINIGVDINREDKIKLIDFVRQELIECVAEKSGILTIKFSDGGKITVPYDQNYEAWEISSNFGFSLISRPGGGLYL